MNFVIDFGVNFDPTVYAPTAERRPPTTKHEIGPAECAPRALNNFYKKIQGNKGMIRFGTDVKCGVYFQLS